MEDLNKCLDLRRKITSFEEKIEDIEDRIRFPKSQTISDMPRSTSSGICQIEKYVILKEKLQSKKFLCETELNVMWGSVTKRMMMCNVSHAERYLMYLRYNSGYSWKKCTEIMQQLEGEKWNENKTFRVYRKVVKLLSNSK